MTTWNCDAADNVRNDEKHMCNFQGKAGYAYKKRTENE